MADVSDDQVHASALYCFHVICTQPFETFTEEGADSVRLIGGERRNSNSKTLFYKDYSLGSVKNLTTSPC